MLIRKTLPLALIAAATSLTAQASSHREAPFISLNPSVDGTDFYMFRSYETGRDAFVTLLANYNPLQDPFGGPTYFALNPNALYEIHIDNNGDAVEDLTFQFRFTNTYVGLTVPTGNNAAGVAQVLAIPLNNLPPASGSNNPTLNRIETYTVGLVRGTRRGSAATLLSNVAGGTDPTVFTKPLDNIGNKSIPNYATYANQYRYDVTIPGCTTNAATQGRLFVGQRNEGFVFNIGESFDLFNLNPLGPRTGSPSPPNSKNITTLALEVPISCLTTTTGSPAATQPIIGGWTTSSLRQGRVLNPTPQGPAARSGVVGPEVVGGAWTQVSRLGTALVNEVVIGLTDKDRFNSSQPVNDAQFAAYVTNPTLPVLLNALFGNAARVPPVPRNDLVAAFLTGIAGVNQPPNVVASEELRLNTAIAPTAPANQNSLGAAQCFANDGTLTLSNTGCDPAGFPNGRRPVDDVIDIALTVEEGFLLGANDPNRNSDGSHHVYTDGATYTALNYDTTFPYLKTPIPGSPNGPLSSGGNGQPVDGTATVPTPGRAR